MSPVSIMYSLRSYNAGEVVEGVLCESRCSCLGKGCERVRGWHDRPRGSRIERSTRTRPPRADAPLLWGANGAPPTARGRARRAQLCLSQDTNPPSHQIAR